MFRFSSFFHLPSSFFPVLSLFFILGIFMSRSRKWRKRFGCGHRGYGQFCHCCADRDTQQKKVAQGRKMAQVDREMAWVVERVVDGVDLRDLPRQVAQKAKQVLEEFRQGWHPGAMGGKQFGFDRDMIRVPVGYRYRLLCERVAGVIKPIKVLSHEAYNSLMRNTRR